MFGWIGKLWDKAVLWWRESTENKTKAERKTLVAAVIAIGLTGFCWMSGSLIAMSSIALAGAIFAGAVFALSAISEAISEDIDLARFIAERRWVRAVLEISGFVGGFFLGGPMGILGGMLLGSYVSVALGVLSTAYRKEQKEYEEKKQKAKEERQAEKEARAAQSILA